MVAPLTQPIADASIVADTPITVRRLSEAEFRELRHAWQSCLHASEMDPLFMSWGWIYSWWETWSQILGLELLLFGAFDDEGQLVGVGPFYRRINPSPSGLRVNRIHCIGNAWRLSPTVRTEYVGIIAKADVADSVREQIFAALRSQQWDEVILTDASNDEVRNFSKHLCFEAAGTESFIRIEDRGIRLPTGGSFSDWTRALGKNTRLKVLNRRSYLSGKGDIDFEVCRTASQLVHFFELLNSFHQKRWGKPAFDREAVNFHRSMLDRLGAFYRVECSILKFNGTPISVLYDIFAVNGRYNIQAGFLEDFDPKMSVGKLHLGYAIEEAFNEPECHYYDLLAGEGKNEFYKDHFKGEEKLFFTVQFTRRALLKFLYRNLSIVPQKLRSVINRPFKL